MLTQTDRSLDVDDVLYTDELDAAVEVDIFYASVAKLAATHGIDEDWALELMYCRTLSGWNPDAECMLLIMAKSGVSIDAYDIAVDRGVLPSRRS